MTSLGGFVVWLQARVLFACTGCGYYLTRGSVRWDEPTHAWLVVCGWCSTTVVRSTHLDPIPREDRFDA